MSFFLFLFLIRAARAPPICVQGTRRRRTECSFDSTTVPIKGRIPQNKLRGPQRLSRKPRVARVGNRAAERQRRRFIFGRASHEALSALFKCWRSASVRQEEEKKAKVNSKAAARVDNNPAKRIGIVARPPARLCGSSRVIRRYARARGRSFPRGGSRPLGPLSHFFITGSVLTSCLSTSGPRGHIWSR